MGGWVARCVLWTGGGGVVWKRVCLLACACLPTRPRRVSWLLAVPLAARPTESYSSVVRIPFTMPIGVPGPAKKLRPARSFWLVLDDPCGMTCAMATYFVVFFVDYITVRRVLFPSYFNRETYRYGLLHFVFFQSVIGLICWSHLKCMLSNPGTLRRNWPKELMERVLELKEKQIAQDKKQEEDGYLGERRIHLPWCGKCDNYKPRHTHHCSSCGTCIENMDHHCPWMNNCVGKNNHKFFMLFLLYVGTGSLYAITMTGIRLYSCYRSQHRGKVISPLFERLNCQASASPLTIVGYIMSIIFSFLFCLFVTCMCWEQLEEIGDATTMIEKKKGEKPERRGVLKGLEAVFQERRGYRWLLPFRPNEMKGYFPEYGDILKSWGLGPMAVMLLASAVVGYWGDLIVRLIVIKWGYKAS